MAMTQPNPYDHAAIIRVTRDDTAAVIADLVEALEEAERQIEYLHGKFQATGSGEAVLAKIRAALAKAKGEVA